MKTTDQNGLGPDFKKSSACSDSCCCVEVALDADDTGNVSVRDSKTGRLLAFTPDEWRAFVVGVKNGEFDLTA